MSPLQIESLGGFKIHHEVEEGEEVVFRFHHKSKLQGGASVTVSALLLFYLFFLIMYTFRKQVLTLYQPMTHIRVMSSNKPI